MLIEILMLGSFIAFAAIAGGLYQIVFPVKSVTDELGAIAAGFAGGIVGILVVSFLLQLT